MSTRIILFGLLCIVAAGHASTVGFDKNEAENVDLKPENLTRREFDESNTDEMTMTENDEEGCYPQVGCFTLGEPWNTDKRPIGSPMNPQKLQTLIHFYSRSYLQNPLYVPIFPEIRMKDVNFDWNKKSVIIVDGLEGTEKNTWKEDLKSAYLKHVDANVMVVDWGKGAYNFNYLDLISSARVVGRQLGLYVQHLIKHYQADPRKFHLIGHGLGAHICSYVGKEVPGIGRITALDPAQPYFEGFPKEVRIDSSDAKFVDVIHTDASPFLTNFGFGMMSPCGDVDLYVNGGYDQPGCHHASKMNFFISELKDTSKYAFSTLSQWFHCSHTRAYQYFIQAVNHTNECIFWGQKAKTQNNFLTIENLANRGGFIEKLKPVASTCSRDDCVVMGLNTEETSLRGVFLVSTTGKAPYCVLEENTSSGGLLSSVINTVISIPKSIGKLFG